MVAMTPLNCLGWLFLFEVPETEIIYDSKYSLYSYENNFYRKLVTYQESAAGVC